MAKRYYDSVAGGEMMGSKNTGFANMPQEVIMKEYPKVDYVSYSDLGDSLRGIDNQIKKDKSKEKSNMQPEKY